MRDAGSCSSLVFEPRWSENVEGDGRRGSCGVLEMGTERAWEFRGRRGVSVDEGARGGLIRCTVRSAGGAVVLWCEDFTLLYFSSFRLELFVEEGGEREGLTMEYPSFYFAYRESVVFEGSERRGRSVSVVGRGWGFGVGGREGDIFFKGSALLRP